MHSMVVYLVTSLIRCMEFLLVARAIMSWFSQAGGSKIYEFLYLVTEPIILPFRRLTDRIPALRGFPLDIAFLLAFITLEIVLTLLYRL